MSCGYQGYEFGAGYLDSICIDGQLYDADACDDHGNLYEPAVWIPCPMCKPKDAIKYWTQRNLRAGVPAKKAALNGRHLVNDIRKNRGVTVPV